MSADRFANVGPCFTCGANRRVDHRGECASCALARQAERARIMARRPATWWVRFEQEPHVTRGEVFPWRPSFGFDPQTTETLPDVWWVGAFPTQSAAQEYADRVRS
jgi:hypothetical protein